ncbi:MAG: AmpG family muropeptide MFS transporter [Xenococcaceae cyanobacterium]
MNTIKNLRDIFQSRKMAALLMLGFASGLPLFLTSKTLQAWMTTEKVSLATVGAFSLVGLPYSLKFIWSPLLDSFVPPFLGRRRGWLVLIQIALIGAIATMSLHNPQQAIELLAVNAFIIAFLSATQDIVFDAYRTDILDDREMGAGAAIGVLGYRIALLVTGSFALILADRVSWSSVYLLMAALMSVGLLASFFAPEPKLSDRPPSLSEALVLPFQEFFERSGAIQAILILGFIVLYKLGDAFVSNLSTPFLLNIGFTQTDIGAIQGGMGLLATIVGVLAGGAILGQIGINRSLWVFGVLQAISNLAYFMLSLVGRDYSALVLTINIENFCGGLGTAAFIAFLMSLCDRRFSATQYALLSSLMAVSRDILVAPAGRLVEITGWPQFFLISIALALPGLLLLPIFAPWNGYQRVAPMPRPGLDDEDI